MVKRSWSRLIEIVIDTSWSRGSPRWRFSSYVLLCRRALTNPTPRLEHCQHHRDKQGGRGNNRRKDQVAHRERGWCPSRKPPALLGRLGHLRSQRDQNQCGEHYVQHQLDSHPPVPHQAVLGAEAQNNAAGKADEAGREERPDREQLERPVAERLDVVVV